MTKTRKSKPAFAKPVRAHWVAPKVERIDAGQAEVGTRAVADGPFSTS